MSEIVAEGIIEARRITAFAETFASKAVGMKNPLVLECRIHFDDDGLHVNVVDSANVAMVGPAHLHYRAMESYEAPGRVTIGVNLERLIDYVDPADPDQLVRYAVDMETRHLELEYGSADLSLRLIDPESIRKEPDTPDLDLPNEAVLTGEQVDHALDIADLMSDHVRVVVDPSAETIRFVGRSDTDDGAAEFGKPDLIDYSFTDHTESVFSLDYLRALAKPMPADAEVSIITGETYPMRFDWEAMDGHFDVSQTIAPRIQSH